MEFPQIFHKVLITFLDLLSNFYDFLYLFKKKGFEGFMKFIFPKNFNFKNKLFGIIDYNIVVVNLVWYVFILILINIIFQSLQIKIFIFIIFCFPFFLVSITGLNGENILYVLFYLYKFSRKQKLYLYFKK